VLSRLKAELEVELGIANPSKLVEEKGIEEVHK
jgi:hypothetical protein